MLHEEDPDVLGGEFVDDGAQVIGLAGVQTADRLVEEQYLGRRTQSPAQLDEPQDARRQVAGQAGGAPAQSEPLESAVDGASAVIVATNHSAFESVLSQLPRKALLVDPWNVTGSAQVFAYVDELVPA